MGDFLYALKTTTHFVKPCYYTIYLRGRSWLVTSPEKSTMDLLRTTLLHHRQHHNGGWLGHGVFYREHPTEHNKDTMHITDTNNHNKQFCDDLELDIKAFHLDHPSDVDEFRKLYQFANTSLFVMNEYEYTPCESHLRLEGLAISLPADTLLQQNRNDENQLLNPDYFRAYKEFLNSLYFL